MSEQSIALHHEWWHEPSETRAGGHCPCHGAWVGSRVYPTRYQAWLAYWREHAELDTQTRIGPERS